MFNRKVSQAEPIVLPENVKNTYQLNYRLTYDEAYESFFLLANKRSKKWKMLSGIFLAVVAIVMLILRYFDQNGIHYSFIALVAILMLFDLIYAPMIKAKLGARKVAKQNGLYKIAVTATGQLRLPNGDVMDLANDKDARVIETSKIFALRPDGRHTFCIPKRILRSDEAGIREIFKAYLKYQLS